ncbi:MAG: DUF4112 domain-containing protein [Alphaproteobacteria bacterium]|nr:DUF4112 domain-containing protein [Alphaproteobacteria bacterium]
MTEAEMLKTLKNLKWIARFMDNGWGVPFTRFRFGADAFSSLIPIGGDVVMTLASLYLVTKAWQLGAPRALLARMVANVAIEAGIGAVPVVGGILDVLYMANVKNMDMLEEFLRQRGMAAA